jgi:hypothetical protein
MRSPTAERERVYWTMQCHIPDDCNVDTHSLRTTNCTVIYHVMYHVMHHVTYYVMHHVTYHVTYQNAQKSRLTGVQQTEYL